jgi:hypothetical protein
MPRARQTFAVIETFRKPNKHPLQLEAQTARPGSHDVLLRMQTVWNGRPHVAQLRTDCILLAVCSKSVGYTALRTDDTVLARMFWDITAANLAGRHQRFVKLC